MTSILFGSVDRNAERLPFRTFNVGYIVFLTFGRSLFLVLPASGLPHQSHGLSPGTAVRHRLVRHFGEPTSLIGGAHPVFLFLPGSLWCERSNLSAI